MYYAFCCKRVNFSSWGYSRVELRPFRTIMAISFIYTVSTYHYFCPKNWLHPKVSVTLLLTRQLIWSHPYNYIWQSCRRKIMSEALKLWASRWGYNVCPRLFGVIRGCAKPCIEVSEYVAPAQALCIHMPLTNHITFYAKIIVSSPTVHLSSAQIAHNTGVDSVSNPCWEQANAWEQDY